MPKKETINKENLLILILLLLFIPVWFFVYTKAGICGMINPDDITTFQFSIFGENNLIKKIGNIVKNEPVTPPVLFLTFYFWTKFFGSRKGYDIKEAPIYFEERKAGVSKRKLGRFILSYIATMIRLKKIIRSTKKSVSPKAL